MMNNIKGSLSIYEKKRVKGKRKLPGLPPQTWRRMLENTCPPVLWLGGRPGLGRGISSWEGQSHTPVGPGPSPAGLSPVPWETGFADDAVGHIACPVLLHRQKIDPAPSRQEDQKGREGGPQKNI